MQLACSHCGQVFDFADKRPAFCAFCGKSLSDSDAKSGSTVEFDHEAVTVAPDPSAVAPEAEPEVVGGYRLLRVLGEGGMGKVYEAEDVSTGRRVALKLISAQYAGSPDAVERFRREGRLASSLVHARCVFVLAADEQDGLPYIVMELMPGETLEDLVRKQGPLPPREALVKVLDVIDGLKEAHRYGVVHRDVKPSNCFLEPDGRVKVGDFGLAKSLVAGGHLTRTGSFFGTVHYASPEQIKSEPVGPQSDLYSVAATLYCLLTGKPPFHGTDPAATVARIVCDPAPPMRSLRPELPEGLDRVVLRGLEREPHRRWRDLAELEAALRSFLPNELTSAGLGVRFGAFLIDYFLAVLLLSNAVVTTLMFVRNDFSAADNQLEVAVSYQLLSAAIFWAYFALPEAFWGWSLGKRLLRLRAVTISGGEPLGLWRSSLRTVTLWTFLHPATFANWLLMHFDVFDGQPNTTEDQFLVALVALGMIGLWVGGVLLLVSTMRTRNGYRGLHEWVSGTRVIQLPLTETRRNLGRRCSGWTVSSTDGLPDRLGSFSVVGAVCVTGRHALLLGEDHGLGRKVLLWLRPSADAGSVNQERRQLSRTARPRWLAGGQHLEQVWDAFLAPQGHPLPDVVASEGRLSWADTRHLLAQLVAELAASTADGTLPEVLSADQVWVQADGRVQLVDMPRLNEDASDSLGFMRAVVILCLEGQPWSPKFAPAHIRAPVPRYAAEMLDRLVDPSSPYRSIRELQRDLDDSADRPSAVSRERRSAHVTLLATLLSLGLLGGLAPIAIFALVPFFQETAELRVEERRRQDLDALGILDALTALHTDPFVHHLALRQLDDDLYLRERVLIHLKQRQRLLEERRLSLGQISRWVVLLDERVSKADEAEELRASKTRNVPAATEIRTHAQELLTDQDDSTRKPYFSSMDLTRILVMLFLAWPVLWIIWAFLWRGGISFFLLGLALVRWDGRPAWRVQCAWRALLFWAPVAFLIVLSVWLDTLYWSNWSSDGSSLWLAWLAWLAWWGGLALLFPIYLILAMRSPERSLHDRLAGTYLVPR